MPKAPPPPPPLPVNAPGPVVRLVLADGTVAEIPPDPELAARAGYLADELLRADPPG